MKRKNRFLVHIALLTLSLCIMVFGVYSAKQASLTVSGTIGFTAHGLDISIGTVTVTGALNAEGGSYVLDDTIKGYATTAVKLSTLTDGKLNFTNAMYFDDLSASTATADNIPPIVITVVLTNYSMFDTVVTPVAAGATTGVTNVTYQAAVTYGSGSNMAASTNGTTAGGTCTLTITLTYGYAGDVATAFTAAGFTAPVNITKA